MSRTGEPLWWTTVDDGATLFVQQNLVEPPTSDHLPTILAAASESSVQRITLDVRHTVMPDISVPLSGAITSAISTERWR